MKIYLNVTHLINLHNNEVYKIVQQATLPLLPLGIHEIITRSTWVQVKFKFNYFSYPYRLHRVCGRSLRGSRPYLGGVSTPLLTPGILCGDRPQRWGWTSCKYTHGPMQGFLVPDTKLLPQRLHCNPVVMWWERATRGKMKGIKGCGKKLSMYTR